METLNKEKINQLITQLKKSDKFGRIRAIKELGNFKEDLVVSAIVESLRDPDYEVREKAAEILSARNWKPSTTDEKTDFLIAKRDWTELIKTDEKSINRLIAFMNDSYVYVRRGIILTLKDIDHPLIVNPLLKVLNDTDEKVRSNAIEILTNMQNPAAIQALILALKTPDHDIREKVVSILKNRNWEPKTETERAFFLLSQKKMMELVNLGEHAIEAIFMGIDDNDEEIRSLMMDAINNIKNTDTLHELIKHLNHADPGIRAKAKFVLNNIKQVHNYNPILHSLQSENKEIREIMIDLLNRIKWSPKTIEEKTLFFVATEEWYKLERLENISIKILMKLYDIQDPYGKEKIIDILKKYNTPEVLSFLSSLLLKESGTLIKKIAKALKYLNWNPSNTKEAVLFLVGTENWTSLSQLGEEIVDPLIPFFKKLAPDSKKIILQLIEKFNDTKIVPLILIAARDDNIWIAKKAKSILDEFEVQYKNSRLDNLQETNISEYSDVILDNNNQYSKLVNDLMSVQFEKRIQAAKKLDKMCWVPKNKEERVLYLIAKKKWNDLYDLGETALSILFDSLKINDDVIRREIARCICGFKSEHTMNYLLQLLEDRSVWIRRMALKTIEKLKQKTEL